VLGKLHVVEPRKHCAALLGMNLANEIATGQVTVHQNMVAKAQKFVQFDAADPYSEIDPAQWGNMRQQERVGTLKVEEILLPHCQLMVIQLPMPLGFIIESALEFIDHHKPSIALGPVDKEGLRPFVQALVSKEYTVWAEPATHNQKTEQYCVLAFPKDKKVNMRGFKEVKL
jgi:hypothetical protein